VIYVDTSVALAWILAEDHRPPRSLWSESVVSSRLLQYELNCRLHAYGMTAVREKQALEITSVLSFVELTAPVLERALKPFPEPVRTLDALHLATFEFLFEHATDVSLASYDRRMVAVAEAMGRRIHPLP
jgi:predicted nucleic acid-binding protein